MLSIPELKTKRFSVELNEIAILNALKLADIPHEANERATTFLIKSTVSNVVGEADPLMWTVQERMLVASYYISATQEDDADFEIGDNAKYSDYLMGEAQYQHDYLDLGEYQDDHWSAIPLIGYMSEAIERLEGEIEGITNKTHWHIGMMAAQLIPNDQALDYLAGDYDRQLLERMIVLSHMPESDFFTLMAMLNESNRYFKHLFDIAVSDHGIVARSNGGAKDLPYARFLATSAVTSLSKQLCGKS